MSRAQLTLKQVARTLRKIGLSEQQIGSFQKAVNPTQEVKIPRAAVKRLTAVLAEHGRVVVTLNGKVRVWSYDGFQEKSRQGRKVAWTGRQHHKLRLQRKKEMSSRSLSPTTARPVALTTGSSVGDLVAQS